MDEKSNKKRTGKQGKDRYTTNKLALGAENKKRQNLWIRYVTLVCIELRLRSSQRGCYAKNLFYKFFQTSDGKPMYQSLFFNKTTGCRSTTPKHVIS